MCEAHNHTARSRSYLSDRVHVFEAVYLLVVMGRDQCAISSYSLCMREKLHHMMATPGAAVML